MVTNWGLPAMCPGFVLRIYVLWLAYVVCPESFAMTCVLNVPESTVTKVREFLFPSRIVL